MTDKLSTMMWFDTQAEAAANHYVKALPGSRIISIERYPQSATHATPGSVMLVSVELAGRIYALLNGGPFFTPNESVSTVIKCADQAEVDFLWDHMSEGGSTSMCGWVKDKWGFSWQITPQYYFDVMMTANPEVKERVFNAVMTMTKFDIAALEAAAKGV